MDWSTKHAVPSNPCTLTKPIDVSRFFEAVDQALAERTLDPAG